MADSSAPWKSGYTGSVTWNGTTYPQAEFVQLPTDTATMTKVKTLASIEKDYDGQDDFGTVVFRIPEDGSATLRDGTSHSGSALANRISKTLSFAGYVTADKRAELRRGQAMGREVTVELTANPSWA